MLDAATLSRVDQVALAVRERVAGGAYVPGQRIVEAAVAAEFGASRGVVREAFRRLAAEGVLDLEPHRGAVVRRLARADVQAIAPIREVLEGLAARLAAGASGAAAPLRTSLAAQHAAEASDDPVGAFARENLAFHGLILDLADNPRLAESLRPLSTPLSRMTYARLLSRAARDRARAEHVRVVEALIAGDGAAAEATMRAHVRSASEELLRLPHPLLA
ncbi:GntR family transcriptional regulator [Roseomonas sp. CCTCC AB2023176]|uniref:GntR family transcriptional regulator n=1 Tax=Roseomonas sp. CCTCC AB2023176 TaxID=3342640 RepID=UPI0035DCC9E1